MGKGEHLESCFSLEYSVKIENNLQYFIIAVIVICVFGS